MSCTSGWRRVALFEEFVYQYTENPHLARGYEVGVDLILTGHSPDTCGCFRCRTPERIWFFYQHINAIHGEFPIHYTNHGCMLTELHQYIVNELQIGWILEQRGDISHGYLRRKLAP